MSLRGQLIRLAYQRPGLRTSLLPLLKEAAVGLPPHVLTDLLRVQAREHGVDPSGVSTSMPVVQAGMRWTAAVARTLGVWQQRHLPDLDMSELMKDAPEVVFDLLNGDQRTFETWGSSVLPDNGVRPLVAYLKKALQRDFNRLLDTTETVVLESAQ